MEAAWSSETSVSYHNLHGVTTQKTAAKAPQLSEASPGTNQK